MQHIPKQNNLSPTSIQGTLALVLRVSPEYGFHFNMLADHMTV